MVFVRHVAQAERNADAMEIVARKGQTLGIALHDRRREPGVEHAISASREHGSVNVGEYDLAVRADAVREKPGQIAGSARDIQYALTRSDSALIDRETLPQPVQPDGHQVIHQIVASRDGLEHAGNAL